MTAPNDSSEQETSLVPPILRSLDYGTGGGVPQLARRQPYSCEGNSESGGSRETLVPGNSIRSNLVQK
jgi:hypothetical protein